MNRKNKDISDEVFQKALTDGKSEFVLNGILYKIKKSPTQGFNIIARTQEKIVGIIGSSEDNLHDAIQVSESHRKQGIGEMLWTLKTSLDGYKTYEWSAKYSRIRFLIRHGYYPIGTTDSIYSAHIPLSREQKEKLYTALRDLPIIDSTGEDLYVLKRAPLRALFLSNKLFKKH